MRDMPVLFSRLLLFAFAVIFPTGTAERPAAQVPVPARENRPDRNVFTPERIDGQVELGRDFRMFKVAGDSQIPNAFSMTDHPGGGVIVSGPGYIRWLRFEASRLKEVIDLPDPPQSGAQGLCVVDNDHLLFVADGGVRVLFNCFSPDQSAAKSKLLFEISTGREHDAHAIRQLADGWIYLICGNSTVIDPRFFANAHSPVKSPRAGFLMRFKMDRPQTNHPDVDQFQCHSFQIFAHGFRNPYDFDFDQNGSVLVYDSDGERDVSLPWYRPTRVYRVAPGDDAGWVSKNWKRPASYFDMPPLVAELGRGSPTGVCFVQQPSLGSACKNSLLVADWTFGRIMQIRHQSSGDWSDQPFLKSQGQFGFAVTDLTHAKDGHLYATVGGRGTEGGLYQIQYTGLKPAASPLKSPTPPVGQSITDTDNVLQEILTRTKTSDRDTGNDCRQIRSVTAIAWPQPTIDRMLQLAACQNPEYQLAALESFIGRQDIFENKTVAEQQALANRLIDTCLEQVSHFPKRLRLAKSICGRLPQAVQAEIINRSFSEPRLIPVVASLPLPVDQRTELLKSCLRAAASAAVPLPVSIRAAQLLLGGCGQIQDRPAEMFASYVPNRRTNFSSADRQTIRTLLARLLKTIRKPTGEDFPAQSPGRRNFCVDEIYRLAAMLRIEVDGIAEEIDRCQKDQVLVGDQGLVREIHLLNCFALCQNINDTEQARWVAGRIVSLAARFADSELNRDRHWEPRMKELVRELAKQNEVASAIAGHRRLGPENSLFVVEALQSVEMPNVKRRSMIDQIVRWCESNPDLITTSHVRIVSQQPDQLGWLRQFSDRIELQSDLVRIFADSPQRVDQRLFLAAILSRNLGTVKYAAIGLRRLRVKLNAKETESVLKSMLRLRQDRPSVSVRDQLVLLLRSAFSQDFAYQPKTPNQEKAVQRWVSFLKNKFPNELVLKEPRVNQLPVALSEIDWSAGDAGRGEQLYRSWQCASCHAGDQGRQLGPSLEGITKRFNRDDLFTAIVEPDKNVSDRYRANIVVTTDGDIIVGLPIYEAVDGITLMQSDGRTRRINQIDIEAMERSQRSLMPSGLLDKASAADLADLWQWLKSL